MLQYDPNLDSIELAAKVLEPILNELVLVGGCAVGLLITDRGRPPVRHTIDVDLLTEVTPLSNYYVLCEKLRGLGFKENQEVICRWTKGSLIIDVMPADVKVLGFTNRWYELAVKLAVESTLPSGVKLRHISAPLFIASKIESFYGRGEGNYEHHDIEDIINIVDGRSEIIMEIESSPSDIKNFIREEFEDFLSDPQFIEIMPRHMSPEIMEQARVQSIIERFRTIAGI